MKRNRYTEEQIISTLEQQETGTSVKELIRQIGITEQTFYRWKNKYVLMLAVPTFMPGHGRQEESDFDLKLFERFG